MEESKQQEQLFRQMQQQQQQMQLRQQQLFLMQQQLLNQQQHRPTGLIQTRPINPNLQNINPNPSFLQQQQQNVVTNQQMMMMQQQRPTSVPVPVNQKELQFAYQDSWRVCHPDFKRPFVSLEDACERLLPYHVVADYEAEEDDRIVSEALPRSQQWDNNIAAKVAEFTATFEKQVEAFNLINEKRRDGEMRAEERLMIEQALLQDERKACVEVKAENEARLRMAAMAQQAGQGRTNEMMMMMMGGNGNGNGNNPLRANAVGNRGEQGRGGVNGDEMMLMMNGWGNGGNGNGGVVQREEREVLEEDFLNDEETGGHENWRGNVDFDLNTQGCPERGEDFLNAEETGGHENWRNTSNSI